jgi:hypothetical protein
MPNASGPRLLIDQQQVFVRCGKAFSKCGISAERVVYPEIKLVIVDHANQEMVEKSTALHHSVLLGNSNKSVQGLRGSRAGGATSLSAYRWSWPPASALVAYSTVRLKTRRGASHNPSHSCYLAGKQRAAPSCLMGAHAATARRPQPGSKPTRNHHHPNQPPQTNAAPLFLTSQTSEYPSTVEIHQPNNHNGMFRIPRLLPSAPAASDPPPLGQTKPG